MEHLSQPSPKPRGVLRTAIFAAAALLFLYFYIQTRQLPHLLTAVGFALILPNTFLHPVNWRRPTDTTPHRSTHPLLTLLSVMGAILILAGLVLQWL